MSKEVDCVIVGGGAAGALMSALLGRMGIQTMVIEKRPLGQYSPQWVALSYGSELQLKNLLPPLTVSEQALIKQVEVSVQGAWGCHRIDAASLKVPHLGRVLPMAELERHFQALALESKKVIWAQPSVCDAVRLTDSGWELQQGSLTVKASLLIVADGAQSKIAQSIGLTYHTHAYQYPVHVFRATWEKAHGNRAFERFTNHGTLALLPINTHETIGVFSLSPRIPMEISTVERVIKGRLGVLKQWVPLATLDIQQAVAKSHTGARVVLLGNAAHALHPIAAQGFNLIVRDAVALATLLKERIGQDIGAVDLLQTYHESRLADQDAIQAVTHQLAEGVTEGEWSSLLMGLGLQVSRLPAINKMIGRFGLGMRGDKHRV